MSPANAATAAPESAPVSGELVKNEELEKVTTAVAQLDRVAAGIAALSAQYKGVVFEVATSKGMDEARKARAAIRTPRVEVEKIRKEAKAPVLALGRMIDTTAASIKTQLAAIEDPIDLQITTEENRKENERLAKIEADRARQEAIRQRIAAISNLPAEQIGAAPDAIDAAITNAQQILIDDTFGEWQATAQITLTAAIAKMQQKLLSLNLEFSTRPSNLLR